MDVMDLSVKKPAGLNGGGEDLPQDLSVKRPRMASDVSRTTRAAAGAGATTTSPPLPPSSKKLPPVSLLSFPFNTPPSLDMLARPSPDHHFLPAKDVTRSHTAALLKAHDKAAALLKAHDATAAALFKAQEKAATSLHHNKPRSDKTTARSLLTGQEVRTSRVRAPPDFKALLAESAPAYLTNTDKPKKAGGVVGSQNNSSSQHYSASHSTAKTHHKSSHSKSASELLIPKHTALIVPDPKTRYDKKGSSSHGGRGGGGMTTPPAPGGKVRAGSGGGGGGDRSLLFPHGVNHISTSPPTTSLLQDKRESPTTHKVNGHATSSRDKSLSASLHAALNGASRSVEIQTQSYICSALFSSLASSIARQDAAGLELSAGGGGGGGKRSRRKQERPQKRIKMDEYMLDNDDDEDYENNGDFYNTDTGKVTPTTQQPALAISDTLLKSDELLNKVTDAAQNGELSRGLDAIFGEAGLRAGPEGGGDEDEKGATDGSLSSSASPVNGHSLTKDSGQSGNKKKAGPHASQATIQNRERRKRLRLYGQAYTTPSGKVYPQRKVSGVHLFLSVQF
jgi:hypothetical protein